MFGRVLVGRRLGGVQGVVHSGTRERDPDAGPGTQAFSVIATLSRVSADKTRRPTCGVGATARRSLRENGGTSSRQGLRGRFLRYEPGSNTTSVKQRRFERRPVRSSASPNPGKRSPAPRRTPSRQGLRGRFLRYAPVSNTTSLKQRLTEPWETQPRATAHFQPSECEAAPDGTLDQLRTSDRRSFR